METGAVSKLAAKVAKTVFLGALVVFGCGTRGIYHRVKAGESLSIIGGAYGVPYLEIARANDLDDPRRIYAGQKLLIPGARRAIDEPLAGTPRLTRSRRSSSRSRPADAPDLVWPIPDAPVTSLFGPRGSRYHDGIDIGSSVGSPIRAAAAGEVVFAGVLSGYGNILIVRHGSGYSTLYAHNSRHYVAKGRRVKRGQRIAAVGRSGRVTGPNLHFEVRLDNQARDPMIFLPPRGLAAAPNRSDSRVD